MLGVGGLRNLLEDTTRVKFVLITKQHSTQAPLPVHTTGPLLSQHAWKGFSPITFHGVPGSVRVEDPLLGLLQIVI